MRWTKIVLLFQAIVTLILGFVFISQVLQINSFSLQENYESAVSNKTSLKIEDIKQRYTTATYVLLLVGLMELAIIIKLVT